MNKIKIKINMEKRRCQDSALTSAFERETNKSAKLWNGSDADWATAVLLNPDPAAPINPNEHSAARKAVFGRRRASEEVARLRDERRRAAH